MITTIGCLQVSRLRLFVQILRTAEFEMSVLIGQTQLDVLTLVRRTQTQDKEKLL